MDLRISTKMQGLEEFQHLFRQIPVREQRKVLIPIFKRAARPTVKAMKSEAPVSNANIIHERKGKSHKTRNLKKSIRVTVAKKSPTIFIGPTPGGANDAWYWLIVSLGHRISTRKFGAKEKKRKMENSARLSDFMSHGGSIVPPNTYLDNAWKRTQSAVFTQIKKEVSEYLVQRFGGANGR